MQEQVPKARRNADIILWHPSGVRRPVPIRNREPGGRSPFTLNDHRLLSANPRGWRESEFIFRRSATGQLLELFGVPSPLHGDLGGGAINLTEVVRREFD